VNSPLSGCQFLDVPPNSGTCTDYGVRKTPSESKFFVCLPLPISTVTTIAAP
jgi:hypothetical protein